MPPKQVCDSHQNCMERIHENIGLIHQTNVRMETKLDTMVKSTNGMHDDLYSKDNGVIIQQVKLNQQGKDQKKLLWAIVGGVVVIGAKILMKGF